MIDTNEARGSFQNISQRVAYSYLRSLSEFTCVMPAGSGPGQQGEMEAVQKELHEFFQAFYAQLFQTPELFGLPLAADDCIEENEPHGKRQVKATPLFQVEYSERYQNLCRLYIKCASTNRIAPLIPRQPRLLQEDFFQRANRCNGDKCGWCKNRKNLGPSTLEHDGTPVTLCWYTNPDVREVNGDTVELIQQYAWMHEALA